MKILIVEDDFTCRCVLQEILTPYGECHMTVNGREGLKAFKISLDEKKPYDLVCLDIMMPMMDGQEALSRMREEEGKCGIAGLDCSKIIMTTALADKKNIIGAFRHQCDGYIVKPYDSIKVLTELRTLELLPTI